MIENVNYNTKKQQFEIGESSDGQTIDAYTKTESDNKFALKTSLDTLATKASVDLKADKTALTPLMKTTDADTKFATKTEVGNYLLKTDATSTYATKTTTYTKTEADGKFALKTEMLDVEARLTALEGL